MGIRNRVVVRPASLCSLAGRYDSPILPRFLAPIDRSEIPAQTFLYSGFNTYFTSFVLRSPLVLFWCTCTFIYFTVFFSLRWKVDVIFNIFLSLATRIRIREYFCIRVECTMYMYVIWNSVDIKEKAITDISCEGGGGGVDELNTPWSKSSLKICKNPSANTFEFPTNLRKFSGSTTYV